MAANVAAGILVYRRRPSFQVLLAHPGGPLWAKKDEGAWSIPKGEPNDDEDLTSTAIREFEEETAHTLPDAPLIELGSVTQKAGKVVHCWAIEGDFDPEQLVANTFEMEWPPRSGKTATFPEVDRFGWFSIEEARSKINPAQRELLDRLLATS